MSSETLYLDDARSWYEFKPSAVLLTLVLIFLALLVLYPIALLLVTSLQSEASGAAMTYSFESWRKAFNEPGILRAFLNTLLVTGLVQGISIPIAILIAWVIARTDMPGAGLAEILFWVTFFIPTLAITSGWILVWDPKFGLANQLLIRAGFFESAPFNIYSLWGIVFTHLTSLSISTKVMMMAVAFRNMDASLEEAARVSGAGALKSLFRIVVPASAPMIFVASLMSLIRSFESFEVELILGTPFRFSVYSTKIYSLINQTPMNYSGATALSMFILLAILPLVILQHWVSRRRHYNTLTGRYKPTLFSLGKWRWPIAVAVYAAACLATIIPLVFLVTGSVMNLYGHFEIERIWSLRHWGTVFSDPGFLKSLSNTVVLGLGTMAVSVIACALLAYVIARTSYFARWAFDLVTWLPFMIPGIVLSLGYMFFSLDTPLMQFFYGTKFLLVVILALTVMTFSVQMMKGTLFQLGFDLEEAGRVSGGSLWFTARHILIPLMLPTAAVVAVMVFGSVSRQVGSIVLLTTAETEPLSVLQLGYLRSEDYSAASVVGAILAGLGIILAIMVRKSGYKFGAHQV
ncbi:MAG TPA: iron ABC transporter permease [Methylomirabilota bacterium]|nr:iron ABC transporter permease [Methylomirabilota bacterium]